MIRVAAGCIVKAAAQLTYETEGQAEGHSLTRRILNTKAKEGGESHTLREIWLTRTPADPSARLFLWT